MIACALPVNCLVHTSTRRAGKDLDILYSCIKPLGMRKRRHLKLESFFWTVSKPNVDNLFNFVVNFIFSFDHFYSILLPPCAPDLHSRLDSGVY